MALVASVGARATTASPPLPARIGIHWWAKRLVWYEVQTTLFFSALMLFFLYNARWTRLEPIWALATLGAAIPFGPVLGLFRARRVAAKCGVAGVYRTKPTTVRGMLLGLFLIVGLIIGFTLGPMYLQFTTGVDIGSIWMAVLTPLGFAALLGLFLLAPVGTILFERRRGFHLWVLGTPSLWISDQFEFRRLAVGDRPSVS